jgi:hypothetical protein
MIVLTRRSTACLIVLRRLAHFIASTFYPMIFCRGRCSTWKAWFDPIELSATRATSPATTPRIHPRIRSRNAVVIMTTRNKWRNVTGHSYTHSYSLLSPKLRKLRKTYVNLRKESRLRFGSVACQLLVRNLRRFASVAFPLRVRFDLCFVSVTFALPLRSWSKFTSFRLSFVSITLQFHYMWERL